LKRKMKKGVLEGTTMGVDEREKLRKNKRCFWKKRKEKVKGKKHYFNSIGKYKGCCRVYLYRVRKSGLIP